MPITPTHPRRQRRTCAVARTAVVLVLAWVAACGGGDDDGEADTSPRASDDTTTTPSAAAPATPEEEASAAYLEFVEVVEELAATDVDPSDSDLNRLAVDPVLGEVQDSLSTMRAENHRAQIGDRTSHDVMSVLIEGPGSAVVRDCNVANDTTTDLDDGSIVDSGLSTRMLEARLALRGEGWVVSDVATVGILNGEVTCSG